MDIRWAFLTVPLLAILFLILGYGFKGERGLMESYDMLIANLPVYLVLYAFSIFLLIVWFRTARPSTKTVVVRRVRTH